MKRPNPITGELVDSKCNLGVMNPGSGKVHRDCAARCVSGGVPLALVPADSEHYGSMYFVQGAKTGKPPQELVLRVGEVMTVSGQGVQIGRQRFLIVH